MIKRNEILADLHMHTVASLHGYSTVAEMVKASKDAGLKYIAITDHLFQNEDYLLRKNETARIEYLSERMRYEDIKVIGGVELNLNQHVIDLKNFKRAQCWMPVGLHSWFLDFENLTLEDLYNMFEDKAKNNICTAFAHIERDWHKINPDYDNLVPANKKMLEKIVLLAKNTNTPLELNETSFVFNFHNPTKQIYYWLGIAKELNTTIYLGSDSHYCSEVGHFENSLKALNEIGYPKDLIINLDENKLEQLVPDCLK